MIDPWIPAITSTAALTVVMFILRVPFQKAVESSIQSKFDRDLEKLRTEFRREEERLRADFRRNEEGILALRSGALANMTTRQAELGRRRLQALEAVWAAVIDMSKLKWGVQIIQLLQVGNVLEESESEGTEAKKLREFIKTISGNATLSEVSGLKPPDKERPFTPELVWAVFTAYRMVLLYPPVIFAAVEIGAGKQIMSSPEKMMDMLKAVLPHQTNFIDQHRETSFAYLADELEAYLLKLIKEALDSPESDAASVKQANAILAAADALQKAQSESRMAEAAGS